MRSDKQRIQGFLGQLRARFRGPVPRDVADMALEVWALRWFLRTGEEIDLAAHTPRSWLIPSATQQRFIDSYRQHDGNATRAYLDTHPGVSLLTASVNGSRLLQKPVMVAALGRPAKRDWTQPTAREARFIAGLVRHGNATRAYREVWPRASQTTAEVNGCRLRKKPVVAAALRRALESTHKRQGSGRLGG
jgi:hypothetical protein